MRDVTLGAYYAADSKIHKMDPRFKMIIALIYMVGLFFVDTFFVLGIIFILLVAVAVMAKLPLWRVLKSVKGIIALMLVSVIIIVVTSSGTYVEGTFAPNIIYSFKEAPLFSWWIFSIYESALILGGIMATRVLLLMLGPTVLTLTTTPTELTDALGTFMTPLTLIKFPTYVVTLIMSIALRMVPTLFSETDKIMRAQKARCAGFDSKNIFRRAKALISVLVPLFISALKHALALADAMDSRCYKSTGRTRYKKIKPTWIDFVALVLMVGMLFMVLAFNYNWWGWQWIADIRNVIL